MLSKKMDSIEGYIIGSKKYKEKDAIIYILTKSGIVSIFGRSYKNPNSKYHVLNNTFLHVKLLGESKNTFKVKEYDILDYRYVSYFNLEEIQIIYKVIKLIKKNEINDQEIYEMFEFMLEVIKDDTRVHTKEDFVYYFMCKILSKNSVKLNFKKCVRCGATTNFKTFLLSEGGLICSSCYRGESIHSLEDIRCYKKLFFGKINNNLELKIKKKTKEEIENLLIESSGIYL